MTDSEKNVDSDNESIDTFQGEDVELSSDDSNGILYMDQDDYVFDDEKIDLSFEVMPWSEYHRPDKINDVLSHPRIRETMSKYLETRTLPHLMLYGPPGTGKTSIIRAFGKQFYGENYDLMVMEINASENRGIDVVRIDIKNFVMATPNFRGPIDETFKMVILDEADHLTPDAQGILRHAIEKYTKFARFVVICNDKSKIIPAIESRTTTMKFPPLNEKAIKDAIKKVEQLRKLEISDDASNILVKVSNGDMRDLLNKLQALSMESSKGEITEKMISRSSGFPTLSDIEKIMKIVTDEETKLIEKIRKFEKYIIKNGLDLTNVMSGMSEWHYEKMLRKKETTSKDKKIFQVMADIEVSMCYNNNDNIHARALVSSHCY